jgi:hypothetical protein
MNFRPLSCFPFWIVYTFLLFCFLMCKCQSKSCRLVRKSWKWFAYCHR